MSKNTIKLYIAGAGSGGLEVLSLVNRINSVSEKKIIILGFIDEKIKKKKVNKIPIYKIKNLKKNKQIYYICSVFNPKLKVQIEKQVEKKFSKINLIHPNVELPCDLKIGLGNIIFQNVHLSYNLTIGDNNLISFACDLGHDLRLENNVSIGPNSTVNGKCTIKNNVQIGSGCIINVGSKIPENCLIGSGTFLCKKNIKKDTKIVQIPRYLISKN